MTARYGRLFGVHLTAEEAHELGLMKICPRCGDEYSPMESTGKGMCNACDAIAFVSTDEGEPD